MPETEDKRIILAHLDSLKIFSESTLKLDVASNILKNYLGKQNNAMLSQLTQLNRFSKGLTSLDQRLKLATYKPISPESFKALTQSSQAISSMLQQNKLDVSKFVAPIVSITEVLLKNQTSINALLKSVETLVQPSYTLNSVFTSEFYNTKFANVVKGIGFRRFEELEECGFNLEKDVTLPRTFDKDSFVQNVLTIYGAKRTPSGYIFIEILALHYGLALDLNRPDLAEFNIFYSVDPAPLYYQKIWYALKALERRWGLKFSNNMSIGAASLINADLQRQAPLLRLQQTENPSKKPLPYGETRTLNVLKQVHPYGLTVIELAPLTRKDALSEETPRSSLDVWLNSLKKKGLVCSDNGRPKKWFYVKNDES